MGPCPHWEKHPALLIRISCRFPAAAAPVRKALTYCSTSPWVGQVSPEVQTNTCRSYCPTDPAPMVPPRPRRPSPPRSTTRPLPPRDELLDPFPHGVHDLRLGHLPDDRALPEDQADALASGHADVGGPRLAWAVDLAAHDGHADLLVQPPELVPARLGQRPEVPVRAPARGARDEG